MKKEPMLNSLGNNFYLIRYDGGCFGGWFLPRPEEINDEKRRTDCDGAVGHIEGRKGPAAIVDLQKIGDGATGHPIIEVTGGSAQDERQTEPGRNGSEPIRTLPKRHHDEDQNDYCHTNEDDTAQHG